MNKLSGTVTLVGGPCAGRRMIVDDVRYPIRVLEFAVPEFYWKQARREQDRFDIGKDHFYPTMPMSNEKGDVTYVGRQNGTDVVSTLLDFYANQTDRFNEGRRIGRLHMMKQILCSLQNGMSMYQLLDALSGDIAASATDAAKGE